VGKLIYSMIASLDGYVNDDQGNFDWAMPDEEVHAFANELERPVGTYLYGRRMYETMLFWEGPEAVTDQPAVVRDFAAIWRAADKVVYSRTLQKVSSAQTRLERDFDPDVIREMKASSDSDLTIGGAGLAGQALAAGLVDEVQAIVAPAIVGGGTRALPDGVRMDLDLLEERRFVGAMVFLRYRVT